jgi:hypothetical protein
MAKTMSITDAVFCPVCAQLKLFCPICGKAIRFEAPLPSLWWHHNVFGIVCSRECHDEAELMYVAATQPNDTIHSV